MSKNYPSDTVGVYGLTLEIIDNVIAGYGIEHGWIYEINGEKWEKDNNAF